MKESFGQRLQRLRKNVNLTQEEGLCRLAIPPTASTS